MHSSERRRHAGPWRRRSVLAAVTALCAALLWLMALPTAPAQGATPVMVGSHPPHAGAPAAAPTSESGPGRDHKEGPGAVVASVAGVIVVVVFIVGLRSLSVRRRTRNGPPPPSASQGGPRGRGRGLFG
jgi:ferric-dicitrate binding protein FerR (iron transport regulator)